MRADVKALFDEVVQAQMVEMEAQIHEHIDQYDVKGMPYFFIYDIFINDINVGFKKDQSILI